MRAFIAIKLPERIQAALSKLQGQLKQSNADVKWVAPEHIHLTLKFLGEIDETNINLITRAMESAASGKNAFSIRVSCLGAFPTINRARVIWAGITNGNNETLRIAKDLEEKIEKLGIQREKRPFSTHITIGRVRSAKNMAALAGALHQLAGSLEREAIEFNVTKITLFKSTLSCGGPIYAALQAASLIPA